MKLEINTYLIFLFLSVGNERIYTMEITSKIYVAGHNGLVGSAIIRALKLAGFTNIITRSRHELDLCNQQAVVHFFKEYKPEFVFLAAAKVGGIKANFDYPASFIYENLMIEANVIHAAFLTNVKKLLFLGSSCIYPRDCPQPIQEEYLLTGPLELTNKPYALAKIAGIELCQSYNKQYGTCFISCMPTNLYGINDNFDLETSHVLPALLSKIYTAYKNQEPTVTLWGTGKARREFLFVDDLADASIFLMQHYTGNEPLNIGTGEDITIENLANTIKDVVGYQGNFIYDTSKPDGTPQKLLTIEKIKKLGWSPKVTLKEGIKKTVEWYIQGGMPFMTQKKEGTKNEAVCNIN
jgi:GDP-L-fucose synthase